MKKALTELWERIDALSDEELSEIAGGTYMTDGDRKKFDRYIKECHQQGFTLEEVIEYLKATYSSKRSEPFLEEYIQYVTENW